MAIRLKSSTGSEAAPAWGTPAPLTDSIAIPPFPIDALPEPLREWIAAQAVALQVPIELPAFMALAVVSTCVAKRLAIEVRPGWVEPLNTYWIVGMKSGEKKSPVLRAAIAPIVAHERELRVQHNARVCSLQEAAGDDSAARAELARLEVSGPPRLLVDDITPEALAIVMAGNGGRASLMSAEGGIFETLSGRYANNVPNIDLMLKAYSGESVRIDRKVGKQSIAIDDAALTVGLAVQPCVLEELGSKPSFGGRGLLARFMYALPESMVGRRNVEPPTVPPSVAAAYAAMINGLLTLPEPGDGPSHLEIEATAYRRLIAFAVEIEPRLGDDGDLASIADWGNKLVGAVARVAGLLHAIEHSGNIGNCGGQKVSLSTIGNAIRIGVYLIQHAKAAFALMATAPAIQDAQQVLKFILRSGKAELEFRDDIQQAMKGGKEWNAERIDAALRLLVEHGYLHQVDAPPREGPGRRAKPTYLVNPACHNSQNSHNAHGRVAA